MPKRTTPVPSGVEINGGKLRELRKQRGDGLVDFADRCEISFGYLGHIERGVRPYVSPPVFVRLCDALGLAEHERKTLLTRAARRRVQEAA